jgi:hypothetical protein
LKLLIGLFFLLPAAAVLTTQATVVEAASEECRAKPDSPAPKGSHWYYRVDRLNQRHCWYLSSGESRVRQASSLKHLKWINRSTKADIAQEPEVSEKEVVPPESRQEAAPDEQMLGELAAPDFNASSSESLVPHKVMSISYPRPRAGEPMRGWRTNLDLFFLFSALAAAMLVAGGAFRLVDRIYGRSTSASPRPQPVSSLKANPPKSTGAVSAERTETKLNKPSVRRSKVSSPQLAEAFSRNQQRRLRVTN